MKKSYVVRAALLSAAALCSHVYAADGAVHFTGTIVDSTCSITNTVGNPLEVNLGRVSKTIFKDAGDASNKVKFSIALTDCNSVAVPKTNVTFEGTPASGDNTVIALDDESGVATGVGVKLYDKSGADLPLNTASTDYDLVAGDNNLDFFASYVATSTTVTSGPASATANFNIVYP